jgi:hypothetical protein
LGFIPRPRVFEVQTEAVKALVTRTLADVGVPMVRQGFETDAWPRRLEERLSRAGEDYPVTISRSSSVASTGGLEETGVPPPEEGAHEIA